MICGIWCGGCSAVEALELAEGALLGSGGSGGPHVTGQSLNKRSSALLKMAAELALEFEISLEEVGPHGTLCM